MKKNPFFLCLALLTAIVNIFAQDMGANDEKYALKAKPVPSQCEALSEAENAAVSKASKELASADVAGKIRLLGELGKSCHKKSTEATGLVLQDKDPLVRQAAVEALGQLGDQESVESLLDLVTDPDWRVRFSLGAALLSYQKQFTNSAALNRVLLVATPPAVTEGDLRARLHTAILINQLRDSSFSRKPFNYLFSLMDSDNERFRALLGETMLALKETKHAQYELIGILKQNLNPISRRKAAYWLGQLKIEKGRWQLKEAAEEDADESVRKAAAEALKLLGATDEEPPAATPKTKAAATKTKAVKKR
jgi:HEAT repeat protein